MIQQARSTQVDAEELTSTRSERLLAVVLAVFLLIGSVWFYVQVADWIDDSDRQPTAAQQKVLDARDQAWKLEERATQTLNVTQQQFDLAKSDYELALAAKDPADQLKQKYDEAQAALRAAQNRANAATRASTEASEAAQDVEEMLYGSGRSTGEAWAIALIRLGFILGWLAGSLWLLASTRRSRPRYLPLAAASVATGAILALTFAVDYITDYIDPLDLGPIVLSALGAALTIGAFVLLQRWLASRIPGHRVRKGECPFCGYPLREGGSHCEGCGRDMIAPCAACGNDRRVGSQHCHACGAA